MVKETAVLGGGCFWCIEAVFAAIDGIVELESGYSGGLRPNPTYEQVCTGASGHIEVVRVVYDSSRIDFETVLAVFFASHDPTTPNRQGNDVGEQYASVIFAQNPDQARRAEAFIETLVSDGVFPSPVVTRIESGKPFWPAELYHQDYYARNPDQAYCRVVIAPKVAKLRARFEHKLKARA